MSSLLSQKEVSREQPPLPKGGAPGGGTSMMTVVFQRNLLRCLFLSHQTAAPR